MEFAHAGDHGLVGFRIGGDPEGGIFFRQGGQGLGEFLHVALGLGLDGHGDHGLGDEKRLEDDRIAVHAEGVAGGGVLETQHGSKVAGAQFIHFFPLIGLEDDQAGDALLLVLGGVEHVAALLQHTGVNAHEGELAEGVGHYLEGQCAEGGAVLGGAQRFAAIGKQALNRGNIHRSGQVVDHRIEQELHTLVLEGRTAEHGHEPVLEHALADALAQLLFAELARFQEHLHQLIVGLGDRLHQLVAPLGNQIGHVDGHIGLFDVLAQIVLVDQGLVLDEINDAAEFAFGADRQLDGGGVRLEAVLNLAVDLEEIGAGAVHLVDEHHARNLVAIRLAPHGFRLGLDATHGAENGDHTVQHPHRALHLNGEVHVTGGVDDIDAVILPAGGDGRSSDGDAPFPFLGHPVGHGCAVVHLTHLVNDA